MGALHPPLFLITSDVEVLIGFKTHAMQISWLSGKWWRFEQGGSNRPIVARKYAGKMRGYRRDDILKRLFATKSDWAFELLKSHGGSAVGARKENPAGQPGQGGDAQ